MLMPKRTKFRKQHRGRMRGQASRGNRISFGEYGIVALEPCWMTSRQIEAARVAMTRHVRRGGKVWIRVFPDKPFTKKPLEQRMGKGKAPVEGWVAVVKPGRVLFEMNGVPVEVAKEAMKRAIAKLPIKCKFATKQELEESLQPAKTEEVSNQDTQGAV
jgi:large subunit ribosomal protein L16